MSQYNILLYLDDVHWIRTALQLFTPLAGMEEGHDGDEDEDDEVNNNSSSKENCLKGYRSALSKVRERLRELLSSLYAVGVKYYVESHYV